MKNLIVMLILAISVPTSTFAGSGKPTTVVDLLTWLNNNLTYPGAAAENNEEGIVYISFTISENGDAENVEIKAGVSKTLDNEALKTVKEMPLKNLFEAADPTKSFILPVKFVIK